MLIIVDNFEEELNVYDLKNLNHTIEIDIPAIMITKHDGAKLKNYFLLEN